VDAQDLDGAVRLEVYRWFVDRGRPPVPAEIAEAVGVDQEAAEGSLRRLAGAHALVLAPGTPYVWMANPFSAVPTPFSLEAGGRTWFGNCIWDAMGIVVLTGGTGTVRTWCPDCRERLSVSVEGERLASGSEVVHFAVPAARWWDDIGFT
jgi:hypothetical protein